MNKCNASGKKKKELGVGGATGPGSWVWVGRECVPCLACQAMEGGVADVGRSLSVPAWHHSGKRRLFPGGRMGDYLAVEETAFIVEVSNTIKEAVESVIGAGRVGGNAYQHSKVNQWTTNVEQTLSQLPKLGKPCKYIVTCVIIQKNGTGSYTANSCFWDSSTDGSYTVRWENKTMYCIVGAFGLSV
nr:dynein light chain Tctex-type 1-like [Pan paniscus]